LGIITRKVLAKYLSALAVICAAVILYKLAWPYSPDSRLLVRALWVMGIVILSGVSYLVASVLLKFEEYNLLRGAFSRKK
ncbi:MAG: hypothetical protein II917_08425, partial [Synergistaceae bacterium]|nr:hypothetical protein [Synergistaceae bacterium]